MCRSKAPSNASLSWSALRTWRPKQDFEHSSTFFPYEKSTSWRALSLVLPKARSFIYLLLFARSLSCTPQPLSPASSCRAPSVLSGALRMSAHSSRTSWRWPSEVAWVMHNQCTPLHAIAYWRGSLKAAGVAYLLKIWVCVFWNVERQTSWTNGVDRSI